ncbi:putative EF-hand domain-containing protein [Helianthus annuus]|nr:putative EF-hand domain-containing protein [Helianthus annuus]KAJ0931323.1 putative EF-hand domain-containing protein [Helianthus annuus]
MCPTGYSVLPARTISYLRLAFEILDVDHDSTINHEDLKTSYTDSEDDVIRTMMRMA